MFNPYTEALQTILAIRIDTGEFGLLYARSKDLKGLLCAAPTHEELGKEVEQSVIDLYAAQGEHVKVRYDGTGEGAYATVTHLGKNPAVQETYRHDCSAGLQDKGAEEKQ